MDLTVAIVFVGGTPKARIEADCLVSCALEGQDSGRALDLNRRALAEAFEEIYNCSDIEVLFPELGECENLYDTD